MPPEQKACAVCGATFQPKNGRHKACSQTCAAARAKQYLKNRYAETPEIWKNQSKNWKINNRDRQRELVRNWYERNIEEHKQRSRNWKINNSERKKELDRAWRAKNPEKVKMSAKKWNTGNKEKKMQWTRKRQALKRNAAHEPYKAIEIFERDQWICYLCGEETDKTAYLANLYKVTDQKAVYPTIDHYIPLIKGGTDTPCNVRTAHLKCNSAKRDRLNPI